MGGFALVNTVRCQIFMCLNNCPWDSQKLNLYENNKGHALTYDIGYELTTNFTWQRLLFRLKTFFFFFSTCVLIASVLLPFWLAVITSSNRSFRIVLGDNATGELSAIHNDGENKQIKRGTGWISKQKLWAHSTLSCSFLCHYCTTNVIWSAPKVSLHQ